MPSAAHVRLCGNRPLRCRRRDQQDANDADAHASRGIVQPQPAADRVAEDAKGRGIRGQLDVKRGEPFAEVRPLVVGQHGEADAAPRPVQFIGRPALSVPRAGPGAAVEERELVLSLLALINPDR